MNDTELDLFGGKPRKLRDERQLTEALARVSSRDESLREGFLRALLKALGTKRAGTVARQLPRNGKNVAIEAEKTLGPVKKAWFRNSGGRPDLIISAGGIVIIVEAKVDASLGVKQLERYLNHGSVALVSEKFEKIPTVASRRSGWLGQTTWRQLIPELEKLQAKSPTVQKQWGDLLAAVQREGDLGDGLAAWDRGKRKVGSRNRLILQSVQNSASEALAASVTKRLKLKPAAKCTFKLHASREDHVRMDLFLSPNTKKPVVQVRLWGKRRPLRVQVHLASVKVPVGRGAFRSETEASLVKAGFKRQPEGFLASALFGKKQVGTETSPQVALREALEPLLRAVGESGALDGYVHRVDWQGFKR